MSTLKKYTPPLFFFLLLFSCKTEHPEPETDCSKINAAYAASIKPLVEANCLSSGCHNSNSTNGDFTTYEGLKSVADKGALKARIVDQKNMPPGKSLSQDDINKVKCWLESGSPNN
jgi:hypothetical protein